MVGTILVSLESASPGKNALLVCARCAVTKPLPASQLVLLCDEVFYERNKRPAVGDSTTDRDLDDFVTKPGPSKI